MNDVVRKISQTFICVSMASISLVMTGCATSGLKLPDQAYMDRLKVGSNNICLVESKLKIQGSADPLGGGALSAVFEPHAYLEELHEECLIAIDEVMTGAQHFSYAVPTSLELPKRGVQKYSSMPFYQELALQHGLEGVLRVKLTCGVETGWYKTLCLSGTWELVSAEGATVAKISTKQLSEQRYRMFPNVWNPKYKTIYVDLARRNAEEFLSSLVSLPDAK